MAQRFTYFMLPLVCGSWLIGPVTAGAQGAAAEPTHPASPQAESTVGERWSEAAYGISLVPPAGTLRWDGSTTRWASPEGYTVGFELIRSETRFNLEQVAASVMVQMGFARSYPRLETDAEGQPIKPRPERIAERPGLQMFFDVTGEDGREWVYGQAIVMLEPQAAAVLSVHAPQETAPRAREAFAQTLATMHVPLATELDRHRGVLIEAGEAWLATLDPEDLRQALPEQQLYRVQQNGQDVGYLQRGSTSDPAVLERRGYAPPGVLFRQVRREYVGQQMLDTEQEAYASGDGRREVWSHKSTVRPSDRGAGAASGGGKTTATRGRAATSGSAGLPRDSSNDDGMTWSQTGVRGDRATGGGEVNAITVISETPPAGDAADQIRQHERFLGMRKPLNLKGSPEVKEWQSPDKGYLPQVTAAVLPHLLPRAEADYAFTVYDAASGEPTLRTVSVRPQPDEGKLVIDYPTPRSGAVRHVFDAEGRLVESVYPSGVTLRPASPAELAEAWGQRLPGE